MASFTQTQNSCSLKNKQKTQGRRHRELPQAFCVFFLWCVCVCVFIHWSFLFFLLDFWKPGISSRLHQRYKFSTSSFFSTLRAPPPLKCGRFLHVFVSWIEIVQKKRIIQGSLIQKRWIKGTIRILEHVHIKKMIFCVCVCLQWCLNKDANVNCQLKHVVFPLLATCLFWCICFHLFPLRCTVSVMSTTMASNLEAPLEADLNSCSAWCASCTRTEPEVVISMGKSRQQLNNFPVADSAILHHEKKNVNVW